MPNWCENKMKVVGKKNDVEKFCKDVEGYGPYDRENIEKIDFHKIIPMPEEAINDYENIGYNWQLSNWGCKWGAAHSTLDFSQTDDGEMIATFVYDTPWAPPSIGLFEKMVELYPNLYFVNDYVEPGMAFAGVIYADLSGVSDNEVEFSKESFPEYFEDEDYDFEEDSKTKADVEAENVLAAAKAMGKLEIHLVK